MITVVIPSIPPRADMLTRALASVWAQTYTPDAVAVALDIGRVGAPLTRHRALLMASSKWVAFLDDDDEMYPGHLESLLRCAEETQADLVYPWFDVKGGTDPFPIFENRPWSNDDPHQIPITFLVKREAALAVDGFAADHPGGEDELGNRAGEDFWFVMRLMGQGGKIVHLPERTWRWNHHAGNTSGLPSRW